ncbi:uncharacterized protein SAPINGB_P003249 [Magnusiomyces paraingens]|uniref:Uncharacterized protein n=1 Tax=Magnusiomyces paraingens TaxID=2606893 RepID=A0A5E8BJP2_9ASCO|nr:uncharacterized protein SAPINGB_P003249 [Saprochaete ingens]VVT51896.1 unnamed protein product [Saprochaete ingens]
MAPILMLPGSSQLTTLVARDVALLSDFRNGFDDNPVYQILFIIFIIIFGAFMIYLLSPVFALCGVFIGVIFSICCVACISSCSLCFGNSGPRFIIENTYEDSEPEEITSPLITTVTSYTTEEPTLSTNTA